MKKKAQKIFKSKKQKRSVRNDNSKLSRRNFVKFAWKIFGVIAGIEFVGLTLHFLNERSNKDKQVDLFDAGLADSFPKNSVTPFRRGHLYLVRLKDGGFIALSNKCSHLGCSIIWDEKTTEFICPCHASHFDISGEVIKPPAPRALDLYAITNKNGKILINLGRKYKRDRLDKSQITYV